jgi:hypothetical protein
VTRPPRRRGTRRRALIVLALLAYATPASAQSIEFLSRYAFSVSMEHMFSDDVRYVWDANWGGEIDLVDYGVGRATFVANYQTILGHQFREFDPNQGNYILEGSASARLPAVEVAGVFHHVSRHLSDRPKRGAVDWNMIGGRVNVAATRGRVDLQGRADLRGVIQKTFVDYTWELETGGRARVPLSPRTAVVATGTARVLGVDGSRDRGTQYGFRGEGALQLLGRGAALDLYAAAERRIDPYQLEFSTVTWGTIGFRLSSR